MSALAKARRAACVCMCHESGPPDLHMTPGQKCPCKPPPPADAVGTEAGRTCRTGCTLRPAVTALNVAGDLDITGPYAAAGPDICRDACPLAATEHTEAHCAPEVDVCTHCVEEAMA